MRCDKLSRFQLTGKTEVMLSCLEQVRREVFDEFSHGQLSYKPIQDTDVNLMQR